MGKRKRVPDPEPVWTNADRAKIAGKMAKSYAALMGQKNEDAETIAADLIADLMHYVRAEGGYPHDAHENGRMHFDEEERGDG